MHKQRRSEKKIVEKREKIEAISAVFIDLLIIKLKLN